MNSKYWNKVLAGFKKRSESGESVTEKNKIDLDAVVDIR